MFALLASAAMPRAISSVYINKCNRLTTYRPSNTEILTSFMELFAFSPVPWASKYHLEKYMGCFGTEHNVVVSFSNMDTTDDISGLLFGLSCTHKSPMWIHRKASTGEQVPTNDESTRSIALPSFHKLHAWTNSTKFIARISACFFTEDVNTFWLNCGNFKNSTILT